MVGTLDKELPKNVVGQKVWVTMYANSHIINKARIKSRWNLHFSEQGLEISLYEYVFQFYKSCNLRLFSIVRGGFSP